MNAITAVMVCFSVFVLIMSNAVYARLQRRGKTKIAA